MNPFDKKAEKKPNPPLKLLRPRLKEASKKALEEQKQSRLAKEELPGFLRSKQALTRDFILKHALFWTDKADSLSRVRSLVLRDQDLHAFQSTDTFGLHELSTIELLSLSQNHLSSLQPLGVLDSLLSLNLNNNEVYDLTPLGALGHLASLYISNNRVTTLGPLLPLLALQLLHAYNNLIPYSEKQQTLALAARLSELDVGSNDVFRPAEREAWCAGNLRRLNGEAVTSKGPTSKGFSSTAASWRNGRPSTARPLEPVAEAHEDYLDVQRLLQEAEGQYLRADDHYEDQIARNVQLKSQLHTRLAARTHLDRQRQDALDKRQKCDQLRRAIAEAKADVLARASPLLLELYEVTMQAERAKIQPCPAPLPSLPRTQPAPPPQRPFEADEEFVLDEEDPMDRRPDEDDEAYIDRILSDNSDTLQQLRQELRDLNA